MTGIHIRPSVAVNIPKRSGADPCTMIIMGAMGDLTRRKLMPAIYQLAKEGMLTDDFAVLGTARESADDQSFRDLMHEALQKSDEIKGVDAAVWEWLRPRLHFVSGDLSRDEAYVTLKERLAQIESSRDVERRN